MTRDATSSQFQVIVHSKVFSNKQPVSGHRSQVTIFHHSPVVNTVEAKELKSDATYLLKSQTNDNQTIGYQVIVPVEKSLKTIDIDQTTLDKSFFQTPNARNTPFAQTETTL